MESKILNVALEQFEAKNYKHAMILFLSIANENVIAQYYLGAIYRLGLGVEDDQKEAISWFLKAAKQGHPESQFLVGCAYSCSYKQTDLVRYDHEEIERKQEEDFSIWQDTLSYFGLNGIGVEPDEAEAYKWISASADQNYVDAIVALGDMYCFGKCVEKNKNEAFKWYMKAALQENTIALQRLGLFFSDREGTGFKAIELLKRVYNLGDHYSAFLLGEAYEQVHKQNPDYHEAFRWYKISAEQYNNYESQYKLGEYYREGKVVEVDYNQAIRWYKKSIVSYRLQFKKSCFTEAYEKLHYLYVCGHEYALSDSELVEYLQYEASFWDDSYRTLLRKWYQNGYDVGEQFKQTFELLEKAEQGDKKAQKEYGYLYLVNHHVDNISKRKVINWYLRDAENGDPEAQYLLSDLYRGNLSRTEGIQWLKKSADQGFSRAQYDLALVYQDENQAESLEYMKKAAKSYVYAQIELGYDYAHGTVVNKDYKKAYDLYQKAASKMKNIEKKSELIRINFLKLRFNAANDTAELLAKQGDIPALLYMGCLYQYGFEVKRNLKKAIFFYELAMNQGSKEACVQLEEIGNHVEVFVDSNY